MSTQKKVMLSVSLVMSLASIGAQDYRVSAIYILLAGISLFFGLPDKRI